MATPVRYLEKFESLSAAVSYTFPLKAYEWESVESLRTAFLESVGMDFAYDALRNAPAPRNISNETVRFIVTAATAASVDTEVDTMKAKMLNIGRGKLFTIDGSSTRRWCYARVVAMPDVRVSVPALNHVPASIQFQRMSPWFASSITSVVTDTATSPKTFTVTNPGNVPAKWVEIRFRSDSNAGFTNPALLNSTNGYLFSSTRDSASSSSELKVDTEDLSVKFSTDNGASYTDDFANFTIGSNQGSFFQLEPGDNTIVYTDGGTADLQLEINFYAPFA